MTAITQFDLLDPASLARKVNAAHGANTVDYFGLLDPARGAHQMNVAAGSTVFHAPPGKGWYDPGWSPAALTTALGT
jgi:hypothetical protein